MTKPHCLRSIFLILSMTLALFFSANAAAQNSNLAPLQTLGLSPSLLRNVGLDQKLNQAVPLDLIFRDERGQSVALGQFFGHGPVILTLVYYQCPMLCTRVLDGLASSMKQLPLELGKDFTVVTVSIDPQEGPPLAAAKHRLYTDLYGRPADAGAWHFLTGEESQIKRLAQAVGFRYVYDARSGQFAHPSGIMVLTPQGKLARYFYGISYPERDLRLGLVEASQEKIGSPVDELLLCCFQYDTATGRYDFLVSRVLAIAGAMTVVAMALLLFVLFRQESYGTPRHGA